jgi:L-fuculose-phosphate aldolase
MPLHLAVYHNNTDTCALLHSHGPHSVALTMDGKDFVPADFEGQYYFGRVQVLDIPYDRFLQDAPELVASALRDSPITVVRGHGVYAAANDLNLAYKWTCTFKWTCTLELSARTAFLARQAGTILGLATVS